MKGAPLSTGGEIGFISPGELLERTLASLKEAVFVVNPATRTVVSCNQAAEEMFAYQRKDIIGRNTEFLHVDHESYEKFGKELFPALNSNGVFSQEREMRRSDGTVFPTELTVTEVRDKDGERVGVISVIRDITERKMRDIELIRNQKLLQDVIDSSPSLIYALDVDGRFILANKQITSLFKIDHDQMIGKTRECLAMPRQVMDEHRNNDIKIMRDLVPIEFEENNIQEDGPHVYLSQKFPLLDIDGKVYGVCGISTDITGRKLAEEALMQKTRDLGERVKEFTCLYGVSKILADPDKSILEIFEEALHLIPPAWLYPEITCARIVFGDREFTSPGFRETPWRLATDIKVSGKISGVVEVYYQEERPHQHEGPFLKEERDLIDELAIKLGIMVERKEAEKALYETRNLLDEVQAISKLGGWKYESSTGRVTWTDEVHRIHGVGKDYDPSDAGNDIRFYSPEDQKTIEAAFKSAINEGEPYDLELRLIRADGERIWVRTTGKPLVENGRVVRVTGNIMDITDRKELEKALRQSEETLNRAQSIAQTGSWVLDIPTGRLEWSEETCRMFGLPEQKIVDLATFASTIHPDDHDRVLKAWGDALAGYPYDIEHRIVVNGQTRWVRERAQVECDSNGNPITGIGSVQEITERKQAELALAESELNYRTVANFTNDWETWRDPNGRFRYVSPSCERITGYPAERFISNPDLLPSIIHEEDIKTYNEHILTSHILGVSGQNREKEPDRLMFRIIRKDGKIRWIEHVCQRVFDENGAWLGTRGSNRDMTELVEAREQAEAATKLKDQFVSLVSHDLRSPFSSMMGLLRFFTDRRRDSFNEEDRKIIGAIFQSGDRMMTMIDDLLKISRLKTGKITPQSRFFKGHAAVMTVITSLNHHAEQKGIEIINEVPADARLYADQTLFNEVLQNLLSNAIKFCSRGDKITFFVPSQLKSSIAVRDTGRGVDAALIPNLFKHEVKTTTVGTAGELGTGLGLPYSHDIMKAHGGDLVVESEPGKGSVFYAALPYIRPVALVVDDEQAARIIARAHLEKIGIDVIEATDGEHALSTLKDKRPHLIITDINMPRMDGLAFLDILKRASLTREIPVIVMTSMEGDAHENAFRHGADDFVNKPIVKEDFIPRVRRFTG